MIHHLYFLFALVVSLNSTGGSANVLLQDDSDRSGGRYLYIRRGTTILRYTCSANSDISSASDCSSLDVKSVDAKRVYETVALYIQLEIAQLESAQAKLMGKFNAVDAKLNEFLNQESEPGPTSEEITNARSQLDLARRGLEKVETEVLELRKQIGAIEVAILQTPNEDLLSQLNMLRDEFARLNLKRDSQFQLVTSVAAKLMSLRSDRSNQPAVKALASQRKKIEELFLSNAVLLEKQQRRMVDTNTFLYTFVHDGSFIFEIPNSEIGSASYPYEEIRNFNVYYMRALALQNSPPATATNLSWETKFHSERYQGEWKSQLSPKIYAEFRLPTGSFPNQLRFASLGDYSVVAVDHNGSVHWLKDGIEMFKYGIWAASS